MTGTLALAVATVVTGGLALAAVGVIGVAGGTGYVGYKKVIQHRKETSQENMELSISGPSNFHNDTQHLISQRSSQSHNTKWTEKPSINPQTRDNQPTVRDM